jgi:hypothetical protein
MPEEREATEFTSGAEGHRRIGAKRRPHGAEIE